MTPAAGEHAGAILGLCRWGLGAAPLFNLHHQNTFLTIFVRVNPFVGVIFWTLGQPDHAHVEDDPGIRARSRGRTTAVGNAPPRR
jgi:hypothetical protein